MSYTFTQIGSEIQAILDRAEAGGQIDQDIAAKQDVLTFDDTPESGSDNPVKSGGIYDAIQAGGAAALAAFPTDSVSGDIVSFPDGADGIPVKSFIGSIIPAQSGSGDPAPDNVRPISGWTGANITRAGANLYDDSTATANAWIAADGTIGTSGSFVLSDYIRISGENVTIVNSGGWGGSPSVCFFDEDKNYISGTHPSSNTVTLTIPSGAAYLRTSLSLETRASAQVRLGETASTYEPYDGQTIILTFGSTVYAGTITALGGGKWSIQPTHAALTLNGSESWSAYASGNGYRLSVRGMSSGEAQTGWADWLATVTKLHSLGIEFGRNDTRIYAAQANTIPGVIDLASWKSYLSNNNLVIVYPLATLPDPIIVSADDLATLLGSNTVRLNCGSVTEMEYRADTKLYIDKRITALFAALSQ